MVDVRLEVLRERDARLRVCDEGGMSLSIEVPYIDGGGSEYEGEYVIRPQPYSEQVLPTAHKKLSSDVTVERIPYYETSNPSGGYTAIIGD